MINHLLHGKVLLPLNRRGGAALFIALAFLSLSTLLGAIYIRHMTVEKERTQRLFNHVRARQYALAGIENAKEVIFATYRQGTVPEKDYIFTYGVYGKSADRGSNALELREAFSALAHVTITPMTPTDWQSRFASGVAWPQQGAVYHVASKSELARAYASQMRKLVGCSLESIIVVTKDGCKTLYHNRLE